MRLEQRAHPSWEGMAAMIALGVPSARGIEGIPTISLFFDGGSRLGLRILGGLDELPDSPLAEVDIRQVSLQDRPALELSTANRALHREFFDFALAVADRIHLDGVAPGLAIASTLEAWARLLRRQALLSEERQLGLLGELWVLARLGSLLGWDAAVASWMGPASEEHDFVLPRLDLEVKTTLKERRIHQIGSLQQAEPKRGRPLFFLSLQFTAATEATGETLTGAVARISRAAGAASGAAEAKVNSLLERLGWREHQRGLYLTRYALRSDPHLIRVDDRFPAVTQGTLEPLGRERLARIDRVSYAVNLDGMGIVATDRQFDQLLKGDAL